MMHEMVWVSEPGRRSMSRVPVWLFLILGMG